MSQRDRAEIKAKPRASSDAWKRPKMQPHHRRGKKKSKDRAHRARRRIDRIESEK